MNQKKLIGTPLIELANTDNLKKIIEDMWSNQQSLASQMAEIVNFFNAAYSPSDANAAFTIPVNAGNITSVNYNSGQLIIKFNTPDGPDCIKFLLNPLNDNGLPADEDEENPTNNTNTNIIPSIILVDWSDNIQASSLHTTDYTVGGAPTETQIGLTPGGTQTSGQTKTISVGIGDYAYGATVINNPVSGTRIVGNIYKLDENREWQNVTDDFPIGVYCYYNNKVYYFKNNKISQIVAPTTTTIINEVQPSSGDNVDLTGYTELGNQQLDSTSFEAGGKYSFSGGTATLTENTVLPNGVTLKFLGGVIDGNYNLVGTNTTIEADHIRIFGDNITVNGDWANKVVYPEWFGAKGDAIDFGSWPMAVYNRELTAEEAETTYESSLDNAPSGVYPKEPEVFPNLEYLASEENNGTKEFDYSAENVYYDPVHNCFLFNQGDNWYKNWDNAKAWNTYDNGTIAPRLDTIYITMEPTNGVILPSTGNDDEGFESSAFIFKIVNGDCVKTSLSNITATFTDNTNYVAYAESIAKDTLRFDSNKVYYFKQKLSSDEHIDSGLRYFNIRITDNNKTLDANNSTFYIEGRPVTNDKTKYNKERMVIMLLYVSNVTIKNLKITTANVYRRGSYSMDNGNSYRLMNLAGANVIAFKLYSSPNVTIQNVETNHIIEDIILANPESVDNKDMNGGLLVENYKSNGTGCFTYISMSRSDKSNTYTFKNINVTDDVHGTNSENHMFYLGGVGEVSIDKVFPQLVVVKDSKIQAKGKHMRPLFQAGGVNYRNISNLILDNCYIEGCHISGLGSVSQTYKHCTIVCDKTGILPASGKLMEIKDRTTISSGWVSNITIEDSTLYTIHPQVISNIDSSTAGSGSIRILRSKIVSTWTGSNDNRFALKCGNRVLVEDSDITVGTTVLEFKQNSPAAVWGKMNEVSFVNNSIKCKGQVITLKKADNATTAIPKNIKVNITGNALKIDNDDTTNRSIIRSEVSTDRDLQNIVITNNSIRSSEDTNAAKLLLLKSASTRISLASTTGGIVAGNYVLKYENSSYVQDTDFDRNDYVAAELGQ